MDLINSLSGRLLISGYPSANQFGLKKTNKKQQNKFSWFSSSLYPTQSWREKNCQILCKSYHVIIVFTAWLFSQSCLVVCSWSLMSKTNAFLVWDISTIVAHPGRSAYWWGCRGALSSQLGQRKSHHISNFSSAEVVTVVATKIMVVSDEHQNCRLGKTNLS